MDYTPKSCLAFRLVPTSVKMYITPLAIEANAVPQLPLDPAATFNISVVTKPLYTTDTTIRTTPIKAEAAKYFRKLIVTERKESIIKNATNNGAKALSIYKSKYRKKMMIPSVILAINSVKPPTQVVRVLHGQLPSRQY